MDVLSNFISGFQIASTATNLIYCFIGVFIGTLVGVLPGIGPVGAMSILLPMTFGISPVTAIIMLAGIYYGAMYGGSTTSILVNIPGEASSIVTCLDGYQMARRAGRALHLDISLWLFNWGNIQYYTHHAFGFSSRTSGPQDWTTGIFRDCLYEYDAIDLPGKRISDQSHYDDFVRDYHQYGGN